MTTPTFDDINRLARQVAELTDRNEITALVYRVGAALDEGRFEDLRSVYTQDATASTPGGSVQGIDALIAQASRNHSPEQRIQHVITNVLIDFDGDRAQVRSNLIVRFASRASLSEPHFTLGEVYSFDAKRTADGWRLTRVETTPVWTVGSREAAVATS